MSDKRPYKGKSVRENINDYTVIDLETTGRYINSCEIIEMSAVKVRNGEIVDTFSTLVCPNGHLSSDITELTGITSEMLDDAPTISDVLSDYLDFIGNDIVLGHNIASFDTNLIYDICEQYGLALFQNTMLDTYHYARCCNISVSDYKLTTLTKYFGIEHEEAHRALADCIANFKCYEALKPLYTGCYDSGSHADTPHKHHSRFSDATKSLQELSLLIDDILDDGILEDREILLLQKWTDENEQLAGNFPFDIISQTVKDILADGIITEDERALLFNILTDYSNPIDSRSENIGEWVIKDKQICLSGDFACGSKEEITTRLEALGATVKKAVSGKTDYLIVGKNGSDSWSCGNYGTKVKKAMELQAKGNAIKIIKEEEFFKCAKATV